MSALATGDLNRVYGGLNASFKSYTRPMRALPDRPRPAGPVGLRGQSRAALGIFGPGQHAVLAPDVAPGDSTDVVPGVSTSGTFYGPTNGGPQTGSSGFWGYN